MALYKHFRLLNLLIFSSLVVSFVAAPHGGDVQATELDGLDASLLYSSVEECSVLGVDNCSGLTNKQLSFNEFHDKLPKINEFGDVTWQGKPASEDYEIFFKAGDSMVLEQITDNTFDDLYPVINDSSEIVWMGHNDNDWDIYLYSSGTTSKLSDNAMDDLYPKLNNLGDVVWLAVDGHDYEIYSYSAGSRTQITDNEVNDVQVRLNDSGDIMWRRKAEMSSDIFLLRGDTTSQINSDDLHDHNPQLNNNADLVWEVADGNDCEIVVKFAADAVPVQITDNDTEDWFPMINAAGVVVWQGHDGNDNEIFVYADGVITQITDNITEDLRPQINDAGDIAWLAMGATDADNGIYIYQVSNQTISKLSDSYTGHYDSVPDINNQGQVIWSGWDGNDFEIITASAPVAQHDDVYSAPRTLNLQSKGKGFSVVIELPLPDSAAEINPSSVSISMISSGDAPSDPLTAPLYSTGKYKLGDFDGNGLSEMIITFDRQTLIALLEPLGAGDVDLSITGSFNDGGAFSTVNSLKVVNWSMSKVKQARAKLRKLKDAPKDNPHHTTGNFKSMN